MKRHPSLRSLSRDHHGALVAAQSLRRADDLGAATESFLAFWRGDGRRHFGVEEEVLFPAWAEAGSAYDEGLVMRALGEHHRVRLAARRLAAGRADLAEAQALGELLDGHVRFEERELFPAIERSLAAPDLEALGAEVAAAEDEARARG